MHITYVSRRPSSTSTSSCAARRTSSPSCGYRPPGGTAMIMIILLIIMIVMIIIIIMIIVIVMIVVMIIMIIMIIVILVVILVVIIVAISATGHSVVQQFSYLRFRSLDFGNITLRCLSRTLGNTF